MKEILNRLEEVIRENERLKLELATYKQGYEVNKLMPGDHSPFIKAPHEFPFNPIWCGSAGSQLTLIPNTIHPTTGTTTIKFTG